jgi:hypothetical protein
LKVNVASTTPIKLEAEAFDEVESFTYLGSIVNKQGGTDANLEIRIGKARAAFLRRIFGIRWPDNIGNGKNKSLQMLERLV